MVRQARARSGSAEALPDAGHLDGLTDAALCAAWQSSLDRLRSAPSAAVMEVVVQQRQDYLVELVLRHPDGLARWMASGAPAEGNPAPFLDREHGPQP